MGKGFVVVVVVVVDLLHFIRSDGRKLKGCVRSKKGCVDITPLTEAGQEEEDVAEK